MEKYGVIPKKFTKAWWEYFWDYYKWHTIGGAVTLAVILITCVQCATRPHYDVTVTYAGDMIFMEQTIARLSEELAGHISDTDDNGKTLAYFQALTLAKDGTSQAGTEYNSAMSTKLILEFQTGDTYLFLFDRQELDRLLNRNSDEKLFVPLSEWVSSDISELKTAKQEGVDYAVDITGNKFFHSDMGLNMGDSLYIAVRRMRSKDENDEHQRRMYEQSIALANYILENNSI